MLIVRPLPIIKNRIQRLQILRVRPKPSIDVLSLDRNHTPIMPRSSHLSMGRDDYSRNSKIRFVYLR